MDNKTKKRKRGTPRKSPEREEGEIANGDKEEAFPIHDNLWKQVARTVLLQLGMTIDEEDATLLGSSEVMERVSVPDDLEEGMKLFEKKLLMRNVAFSQLYNQLKRTHAELNEKVTEVESSQASLNKSRQEKQDAERWVKSMETELHEAQKARHEAEFKCKLTETEMKEMARAKQEAESQTKTAAMNEIKLAATEKKLKDSESENKELKKQVQSLTQQVAEKAGVIKMMEKLEKSGLNKRVA